MKGTKFLLTLIIFIYNLNLTIGYSPLYTILTSLFYPEKNDTSSGQGNSGPSIPVPVPILDANLTSNACGYGSEVECHSSRYRSFNGACNNLENPDWGTVNSTFLRLLPNIYFDGIFKLPRSYTGDNLPNARELSIELFRDRITYDLQLNLNGMQWGQIITHDLSYLATVTNEDGQPLVCCSNGKLTSEVLTNENCAPVIIPLNDPIHKPGSCLDFERAGTDRYLGCVPDDQEANQINSITPAMDASLMYGSCDKQNDELRAFDNGNLKTVTRRGREWPPQVENVTEECPLAESPNKPCYKAGDDRINQYTDFTVLQILLYHNYIADGLSEINSHWDDERLFQESRSIVIAVIQNINYYEYLPYLLGAENMLKNQLIYARSEDNLTQYINDYNPNLMPGVLNEHTNAAWRYFHTLIYGYLGKNKYGGDLRTIDIQRGRDAGLGSYVDARAACNLSVPKTFKDLRSIISNRFIWKLKKLYKDVSDIDLTVGGSLEIHVPGTRAGPTFLCIMLAQFYRTRVTDRFFYENGSNKTIAFTPDQLESIRSVTVASIFCKTSEISNIQPRAFEIIKEDNMIVSCDEIPTINLTLWKCDDESEEGEEENVTEGYEIQLGPNITSTEAYETQTYTSTTSTEDCEIDPNTTSTEAYETQTYTSTTSTEGYEIDPNTTSTEAYETQTYTSTTSTEDCEIDPNTTSTEAFETQTYTSTTSTEGYEIDPNTISSEAYETQTYTSTTSTEGYEIDPNTTSTEDYEIQTDPNTTSTEGYEIQTDPNATST